MRQDTQRTGQKAQHMNPAAVADDARYMLEQLSFPVDARDTIKARRERAIRRAGLSPAKGMRLWYRQTCEILAHEYLGLIEAYKNHIRTHERLLTDELETLRALRLAREIREKQIAIDFGRAHAPSRQDALAQIDNAPADVAGIARGR